MKALIYHGKHDLRIEEIDRPRCEENHAVIEVRHAGICGSDLTIYEGKHPRTKPPIVLGHEFSGVIVERKGDDRGDLKPGDRVTVEPTFFCGHCDLCQSGSYHICREKGLYGVDADGAFAQYIQVPLKTVYRLPLDTSLEEGAMAEPLAVAVRAVAVAKLQVGERVLVLGGGPIGLLTAQVARTGGAAEVIMVEPLESRAKVAEGLGFVSLSPEEAELKRVLDITGGREIEIVVDAAGSEPAALLGTQLVKRTGRIVIASVYKKPVPYDLATVTYGEIHVMGTCIYTFRDFAKAISLLEGRKIQLLPLISHRYPLEAGLEAFAKLIQRENAQKIMLTVS
jgi:2-desacetyl-2-hydroxyethyl bacteriochlorophyllide A dehydrogenase